MALSLLFRDSDMSIGHNVSNVQSGLFTTTLSTVSLPVRLAGFCSRSVVLAGCAIAGGGLGCLNGVARKVIRGTDTTNQKTLYEYTIEGYRGGLKYADQPGFHRKLSLSMCAELGAVMGAAYWLADNWNVNRIYYFTTCILALACAKKAKPFEWERSIYSLIGKEKIAVKLVENDHNQVTHKIKTS